MLDALLELRRANEIRDAEWYTGGVSLSFRVMEVLAEAGELASEVKKLERHRLGFLGGSADRSNTANELADVIIAVDQLAMALNIDIAAAISKKFNATSVRYGLSTRLPSGSTTEGNHHDSI